MERTCSIDGCERPISARGWCKPHYMLWYQKGDPNWQRRRGPSECTIEGCDKPVLAKGLCSTHYARLRNTGTTDLRPVDSRPRRAYIRVPIKDRFWTKVDKTDGCWLWTGALSNGYGQVGIAGGATTEYAHRWAYEQLVGAIPRGMQLDHLCHNADASCPGGASCAHRRCVNPAHLEPVTNVENMRRVAVANRRYKFFAASQAANTA